MSRCGQSEPDEMQLRSRRRTLTLSFRSTVGKMFGNDAAQDLTIQYGGSMKPENAAELLSQPDVDGGLIGGASLKADSFAKIVKSAPGSKIV